jgi:glucose-1-phosphate cytidylyltransferase
MNVKTENMPPAMILCGGQGTRLRDVTELLPKPMVPIGPQPIVWHIMKNYAAFGVKRFILCLGYKREAFIDYFFHYHAHASDITLRLGRENHIIYHGRHGEEDWEVTLANTGERTLTGGRIVRASKYLEPEDEDFFLTYGDAVADINIGSLLNKHREMKKKLTVTAVHHMERFGNIVADPEGVVESFREKPSSSVELINGGYMVVSKRVIDEYLGQHDDVIFELEPMNKIVAEQEVAAYEHTGFWQCMDTYREHALLNDLWAGGNAPWTRTWDNASV